ARLTLLVALADARPPVYHTRGCSLTRRFAADQPHESPPLPETLHVRPCYARIPRPRCPAVLAGVPRPHQPGRGDRQRTGGIGGRKRRGDKDLCPRTHQEERPSSLSPPAVLPACVRCGQLRP